MRFELYDNKYDEILDSFYIKRNLEVPPRDEQPKLGGIVFINDTPISIMFLRQVEGNYVQMDGLITNKDCSKDERSKANDFISTNLLRVAKEHNFRGIISYTVDKNTITRACKLGFSLLNHRVIFKLL